VFRQLDSVFRRPDNVFLRLDSVFRHPDSVFRLADNAGHLRHTVWTARDIAWPHADNLFLRADNLFRHYASVWSSSYSSRWCPLFAASSTSSNFASRCVFPFCEYRFNPFSYSGIFARNSVSFSRVSSSANIP
jgi:hypothetical protein